MTFPSPRLKEKATVDSVAGEAMYSFISWLRRYDKRSWLILKTALEPTDLFLVFTP